MPVVLCERCGGVIKSGGMVMYIPDGVDYRPVPVCCNEKDGRYRSCKYIQGHKGLVSEMIQDVHITLREFLIMTIGGIR